MALEKLLERINPNNYINELSNREDLTWDIIQKYSALPWPTYVMSKLAPLDYIEDHPDIPWDFSAISGRKDLTIDFMRRYKDKLNWTVISMNVDFKDVLDNMDLPWDYQGISANEKITIDDIIEHPDIPWDYYGLSRHIDVNFIYANPALPWNYHELSGKAALWFILDNLDYCLDYSYLSSNPNLTIDFILEHLDKNWEWEDLYSNPNIMLEDLITNNLQFKDKYAFQRVYPDYCVENLQDLDWKIISEYASMDCIKKYMAWSWNYISLSMNPNITIDFILENKNKSWNYDILSALPSISLEDVLNNWDLPWHMNTIVSIKY